MPKAQPEPRQPDSSPHQSELMWSVLELAYLIAALLVARRGAPAPMQNELVWLAIGAAGYWLLMGAKLYLTEHQGSAMRSTARIVRSLGHALLWTFVLLSICLLVTPLYQAGAAILCLVAIGMVVHLRRVRRRPPQVMGLPVLPLSDQHPGPMLAGLAAIHGQREVQLQMLDTDRPVALCRQIRKRSCVYLSCGLMSLLDDRELSAVFAHELGHLARQDGRASSQNAQIARLMCLLAAFAMPIAGPAQVGVLITAATVALVLQATRQASLLVLGALSRRQELQATWAALELTRDPEAMASALRKIATSRQLPPAPGRLGRLFWMEPALGNVLELVDRWCRLHPGATPLPLPTLKAGATTTPTST